MTTLKEFAEQNVETMGFIRLNDGQNIINFHTEGEYYVDEQFSTPQKEVNGFKFEVENDEGMVGELKVTSKRLIRALAAHDSLSGNWFVITKSGESYSTMYTVVPFTGDNTFKKSENQLMSEKEQESFF